MPWEWGRHCCRLLGSWVPALRLGVGGGLGEAASSQAPAPSSHSCVPYDQMTAVAMATHREQVSLPRPSQEISSEEFLLFIIFLQRSAIL